MILVINRRRRDAVSVSEMFHYMGLISKAVTPNEALCEISIQYRAVILMEPTTLADPIDYVKRLRSYAKIPIFAISDNAMEE